MQKNIISTLLLAIVYRVNRLSSSGQLGENMMNLRDVFPFVYMPVGATFGIARSMIYLALGVWLVWSRTPQGSTHTKNQQVIPWFRTTCLLNILRIVCTAQERYVLSVVVIAALMVVLRKILSIIGKNSTYMLSLPFGLYAGWITIATALVGISQALYSLGQERVTAPQRTPIALGMAVLTAGRVFYKRRNPAQLFITVVALIGAMSSILGF